MESSDTMKDQIADELGLLCPKEIALGKVRTTHTWTEEEHATTAENPLRSELAFQSDEGQATTSSYPDDTPGNELLLLMVSHELGNVLTAINGSAQLLQRSLLKQQGASLDQHAQQQVNAHQLSLVKTILHRMSSLQELIGQRLDVSRIQSGSLAMKSAQQANLAALVRSVVEQYQGTSLYEVVLEASEESIFTSFDAFWIEQVLHNLVGNAIKYSPPHTTVVVGIERQAEAIAPQEVVIWVRDQGSGISQEHHAALFQRFYRVRTRDNVHIEGLGLGLYICHEVIRQHSGRMWLTSEPGRGSIFSFALPLAQV
jgi:two-component system sensor histidine kinase VicK